MTDEQRLALWTKIDAWRYSSAEDAGRAHIAISDFVSELLAQARADAMEAAAKVCDKRAQSRTGYAYDGAEQDEAEACAAAIRAQGQGQGQKGGGNG